MLLALALFLAKPIVFVGGGADDVRYLLAARAWIAHPPVVGALHWDLRHPLVLPVAASTWLFGEGRLGLLLVPLAYALGLMALGQCWLRARFGPATALWWGILFATNPLIHELATRLYPDLGEVLFVCLSLVACDVAGSRGGGGRVLLLLLAGFSAALAMLMRETSFVLPLAFACCFARGTPLRRRDWLVVGAGMAPLLLLETGWLWAATGDPLYRLHVALHHVDVPSNHMVGKVFGPGPVLFNPDLASRWTVDGPVNLHWTVNPIIYFVLEPFYGGAFIAAAILAVVAWRARLRPGQGARLLAPVIGYGGATFAFATYVLMLSQRPRYYVLPMLAAMLVSAVLAPRLWPTRRRLVATVIGAQIIASLIIIAVRHARDQGLPAQVMPAAIARPTG